MTGEEQELTESPRLPAGAAWRVPSAARHGASAARHGVGPEGEEAASWLRQATRFAAADPDLWVMTGPAAGWAQMTRRLLWSTPWQPGRTIAFADLGTWHAVGLVGAHNLDDLTGATADGRTWAVRDGQLQAAAPLAGSLSRPARFPY